MQNKANYIEQFCGRGNECIQQNRAEKTVRMLNSRDSNRHLFVTNIKVVGLGCWFSVCTILLNWSTWQRRETECHLSLTLIAGL